MSKPTGTFPSHATDSLYATGPDAGTVTRVEPSAGELAEGAVRGTAPAAQKFNWLTGKICDWLAYFRDNHLNGDEGGTYAPSSPIEVGGAGFDVTGPFPRLESAEATVADHSPRIVTLETASTSHDSRITSLEDGRLAAAYTITSVATAVGTNLPMALNDPALGAFTSPSGGEITLPSAGLYMMRLEALAASSSAAANTLITIDIQRAAVNTGATAAGERVSTNTSDRFMIAGGGMVNITSPATQKIRLRHSLSTLTPSGTGRLYIVRMGPAV
jgi:hypothetical protein